MLLSLVYVSSATHLFEPQELLELLQKSRRNNAARDITGLLLHVGGNFMQAIEGPPDAVEDLYRRISLDPRHGMIRTIFRTTTDTRKFPDWSMGFQEASTLPSHVQDQVTAFILEAQRRDPGAPDKSSPVTTLLLSFARTMR